MSKKMMRSLLCVIAAVLVAGMVFPGCQDAEQTPETTIAPTQAPSEAPTETPTETPTEAPTEAPTEVITESDIQYFNPLTGESLDAPMENRIFAVTINNVPPALPHCGVNDADIIFELFVNDYATRGLALYSDIQNVETIGSVRSWRYNFTDIALAYDAFAAHAGGSDHVLGDVYKAGIDHFNIDTSDTTYYSFRDWDRHSAGYSREHCLFVKGAGLYDKAVDLGVRVTQDPQKNYGLNFTEDGTPADGETANLINLTFRLDGHPKLTTMTYSEELGKYIWTQYGTTAEDVSEENIEAFENVFILRADTNTDSNGYHVSNVYGSGEGYYACGGKIIPILWHHENETDPFTFTLTDGTPLSQGVGNSYIAICPILSEVEWE